MKKYLPLLLVVMLAFAGCQRGPATYEVTDNPRDVAAHAEKFVKQASKLSKHYTAEDWDAAIGQFVFMGKNYYENMRFMTEEEQMQYNNARMQFISAIDATGDEALALRVKEEYSRIFE